MQRRDFLKGAGAVGAGVCLGVAPGTGRAAAANDKLNLAVIGLGGRGGDNLKGVGEENIVALCDVDDVRAGKAYDKHPHAKKFYDFRQMFDAVEKQIDGVVISTPDHTHFHPAWWAIERGKHVYLEKPLAHSLWEIRKLTDAAAAKKLATQLGAQRHTLAGLRTAVEIVKAGTIGTVTEVHSWIGSSRGMPTALDDTPQTPPASLKWDLWLGPVTERPYHKEVVPYNWRFWWDFGTGEAGNWGCHILDIPYWALDLKYPTHVEGAGPPPDASRTPTAMATKFQFPAEGKRPAVTLHWYQGVPPILNELKVDGRGMNNLFIGTEGMLACSWDKHRLLPADKFSDVKPPAQTLPPSPGFYKEWFNAIRGGEPASCNWAYSGPMAETVLLANISYRIQGGFTWDATTLKATDNLAVEKYLRQEFRKGWEI